MVAERPVMAVPWYLMTSYMYYHLNESVVSDETFDALCGTLIREWFEIEHPHKHLIDRTDLEAGTGFGWKLDHYPLMVRGAADRVLKDAKLNRPLSMEKPTRVRSRPRPSGLCRVCNGNDDDRPCAYPTERPEGCLRRERVRSRTRPPRAERVRHRARPS